MSIINFVKYNGEKVVIFGDNCNLNNVSQLNIREKEICRPVKSFNRNKVHRILNVPVLAQYYANQLCSKEAEEILEKSVKAFYRATGNLPEVVLSVTNKFFLEMWMYMSKNYKHYRHILSSDETESGKSVLKITLWENGFAVMIVAYDYSDTAVLNDPDTEFVDRVSHFFNRD